MTEIFDFWIYRSVGFVICGLMWIIHPVLPNGAKYPKEHYYGQGLQVSF
ncbi:hypothetical protein [uncultured Bacteroides sp.]|nr:hypothetical protein [uncultured Bacteroides sp.]